MASAKNLTFGLGIGGKSQFIIDMTLTNCSAQHNKLLMQNKTCLLHLYIYTINPVAYCHRVTTLETLRDTS